MGHVSLRATRDGEAGAVAAARGSRRGVAGWAGIVAAGAQKGTPAGARGAGGRAGDSGQAWGPGAGGGNPVWARPTLRTLGRPKRRTGSLGSGSSGRGASGRVVGERAPCFLWKAAKES